MDFSPLYENKYDINNNPKLYVEQAISHVVLDQIERKGVETDRRRVHSKKK